MADHPETTALRLAEAATEGPWTYTPGIALKHYVDSPSGDLRIALQSMHPLDGRDVPAAANAAHIAHAHPGRVRAYALCVAMLRERAKRGHASDCVRRLGDDATVYRSSDDGDTHHRVRVGDLPCTCGHDLDLAALAAVDAEG